MEKQHYRKIDRVYTLSDSSVNSYGYRLLTHGYKLDLFLKNPIGYYMHRREEGILLKWEDLTIEKDRIVGVPVVNLNHPRGEQLYAEAHNGFLNAASMGHIVVLAYSTAPEDMLPGQTGPTITKWYNQECSLVDIPGNSNALATVYDPGANAIDLSALMPASDLRLHGEAELMLNQALGTNHHIGVAAIAKAIAKLKLNAANMENHINLIAKERNNLKAEIVRLRIETNKAHTESLLNQAMQQHKLTAELRDCLAADYDGKPEALARILNAMPAYQSITQQLALHNASDATLNTWDDYTRQDPNGFRLAKLKTEQPELYQHLFNERFGKSA